MEVDVKAKKKIKKLEKKEEKIIAQAEHKKQIIHKQMNKIVRSLEVYGQLAKFQTNGTQNKNYLPIERATMFHNLNKNV